MSYGIRVRDGVQVGMVTGNLDGYDAPDGETLETFDDEQTFSDRLDELTPEPEPDSDDVAWRDAIRDAAAAGDLARVGALLVGDDPDTPGRAARRPAS